MPRQPNPTTRRFRLHARNIFLTYPQCPLPKEHALETLRQLPWTVVQPKYIRVGLPHRRHRQLPLRVAAAAGGMARARDARLRSHDLLAGAVRLRRGRRLLA